jgi:hypothetical protein
MLVYDEGIDDNGDAFRAAFRDQIPHSAKDCLDVQALQREQWPALW